jgi:hypothetical protein
MPAGVRRDKFQRVIFLRRIGGRCGDEVVCHAPRRAKYLARLISSLKQQSGKTGVAFWLRDLSVANIKRSKV